MTEKLSCPFEILDNLGCNYYFFDFFYTKQQEFMMFILI